LDVAHIDGPGAAAAACLSISQWHALVREGRAPQPVIRAPRFTRWRLADVRAWLVARESQSAADARVIEQAHKAAAAARAKRTERRPEA
jgi:predicted DNA-binding transcriptional regulator AlpA